MKLVGYFTIHGERIDDLEEYIKKECENHEITEIDMFDDFTINYIEVYELEVHESENGMTYSELKNVIDLEDHVDPNKKYVIAYKSKEIDVSEKVKEKFLGYRLLEYLKENGQKLDYYKVFDGNVYISKCDEKIVIMACGEFGVYKYECMDKEEYENLINGNSKFNDKE